MTADLFKDYLDVILAERSWSWAVIGIAYIIVGLFIRSLFLGAVIHKTKELNRGPSQELKKAYLQRAPLGWVFFLFSFLIVVGLWNRGVQIPLSVKEALGILGAIVAYVFSIIYHLQALGIAAVIALKRYSEKEASD